MPPTSCVRCTTARNAATDTSASKYRHISLATPQGTLAEARRLWKTVGRENVMIKVPGTAEGIPAFQQLISEGININVTLLFSQEVYKRVAEAYIAGLEQLSARGGDVSKIASVASFFISRIDSSVDAIVGEHLKASKDPREQEQLKSILGKVAIANGKQTYVSYQKIFSGDRWKALAAKGAQTQRVLWASTSTKNPNYRDVLYVEELIGPDTVNTIPPATLDAFRDHGRPRPSLTEDVESANRTMETVGQARDLDERSHRQADRRRGPPLRRGLRQIAESRGKKFEVTSEAAIREAPH